MLLEEDTPGPVAAMETKTLDPNAIAAAATTNSVIKNTTGVYAGNDYTTPNFTIKPTTKADTYNEHEDSEDDSDEDNDEDDDKVEEVEPPEEDTPNPISIEINDEDRDDKEIISQRYRRCRYH